MLDLHRVTGTSDWADVSKDNYNVWQRLAARTKGIITPGDFISLLGLLIVLAGLAAILNEQFWTGIICLVVGRLFDILDGWIANTTDTKSGVGEAVDAAFDKIGTLLTLIVLVAADVSSWRFIAVLALPHVVIGIITLALRMQKIKIHPSRAGKLSMAAAWLCIIGLVMVTAVNAPSHSPITVITYLFAIISVSLGLYAANTYVNDGVTTK